MSDLAATNCGGGCGCEGGGNSCLWLILILLFCGGCGGNFGNLCGGNDCGCGGGCGGNGGGTSLIWILILLCCCGGNGSFC
ncbi:MAG: hypothetical protein HFI40_03695 [Lachnospiraceae bacterium]|jgi:hypothetical protein|nr:hypothetical protein [Lachnospiraceae bacterium]